MTHSHKVISLDLIAESATIVPCGMPQQFSVSMWVVNDTQKERDRTVARLAQALGQAIGVQPSLVVSVMKEVDPATLEAALRDISNEEKARRTA